MNYYFGSGYFIPIISNQNQNDFESHDFYNVYVNGDYVGRKLLLSQIEKITDLNNYLHQNGFNDFTSKIDENSIYILDNSLSESKRLKETLDVYLNIK